MSLFKARLWWGTSSGYEEFHDLGCLCTANIDNSTAGYDKVIVGSFQGFVRIYQPRPPAFSPDHVIIEKQLAPVLQLAVGRFVQGSSGLHLASLHPRELCVHTLTSSKTDDGLVYALTLVYKHTLAHTACNMAWGCFGGAKGLDLVCVQSMDGELLFLQQDTVAFSCLLPEFLVPGPLCYCPRTDSIVTVSSSHTLSTFRYQSIAVSGSDTQPKKITADWTASLGESAVDVKVVYGQPSQLLVLGERSVFCFRDSGVLRFMRKLDFTPTCCHAYGILPQADGDGVLQYLVASHSGPLLVFRDSTLVWTAMLEHPPADITTASFRELNGVIVSLDELGNLSCCYLGTDPSLFSTTVQGHRQLDYEELDKEMAELQKTIRQTQKDGVVCLHSQSCLVFQAKAESTARIVQLEDLVEVSGTPCKCVDVKFQLSCTGGKVSDVTVSVSAPSPLTTHPPHLHIEQVSDLASDHVITVVCSPSCLPTTTSLKVSATYTSTDGVPHVLTSDVQLPLSLFCQPALPSKAAPYKITIDTNHSCQSLRALFPDICVSQDGPDNALGFALLTGAEVTLVASKSSSRYRLQSESFPAMLLFLQQLIARLHNHLAGQPPLFEASYSSALPLNEYFEVLEKHFQLRLNLTRCGELLNCHSQQFRAIQKRLLTRFKDKTPAGLAHLDTLLDGTYMQLMALGDKQEAFQVELAEYSCQLSCATSLLTTLLKLSVQMSDSEFAVLQSVLSPCVSPSSSDQGWEEQTDAAITHLLRTTLAKSTRDQTVAGVSTIELPKDCNKIKRHIALLCDRISKGGSLGGPKEATRSLSANQEGNVANTDFTPRLPVAHHFKHKPSLPSLPEHSTETKNL